MQTIQLDLSTKGVIPVIHAKQGDVGRKFEVVMTDSGAAYSIPDGTQFSVWYAGPGGQGNYSAIGSRSAFVVSGNAVTVELITQMLTCGGTVGACLVMNSADGTQLGLWTFGCAVEPVPGMGSPAAEQYYTALSELAAQAIEAAETFETDTTLSAAGKAADAAAVGTALAKKAPAGYGLGVNAVSCTDCDQALYSGWYNVASTASNSPGFHAVVRVDRRNANCIYQTAYGYSADRPMAVRSSLGSSFNEWEYINPPMAVGVEYRTTERYAGKPVYRKRVSYTNAETIGTASGVAAVEISHSISGFGTLVRCHGKTGQSQLPYIGSTGGMTAVVGVSSTAITMRTSNAEWSSREWLFDIAYTKT